MVETGDPAPGFELASTTGGTVRLSETLETGPTVLVFNRGVWCSYCAEQLGTFSALERRLWRDHGADVLGVMVEPIPELRQMRDRFDLDLQLLSDPDLAVTRDYTQVESHDRYGEIPVAGVVVIDATGTVRFAQVADHPGDRIYANWVRLFIRDGYDRAPP